MSDLFDVLLKLLERRAMAAQLQNIGYDRATYIVAVNTIAKQAYFN